MMSNELQVRVEYVLEYTGWSGRTSWFKLFSFEKEADAIYHLKAHRESFPDQDWDYRVIKKITLVEIVEYANFRK